MQHIALGREIEGNWWTLFRSDAIDQLVKQAVAHNRSLAASTATLKQAREPPPVSVVNSTGMNFWAHLGKYPPSPTSPSGLP